MRFCQSFFIVLHYLFPAHSGPAGRRPAASRSGYIRLLSPSLAATQLPHGQLHIPLAAPGRSAGYEPPPWGKMARRLLSPSLVATRSRMGNSIFPWLLRAALAAASHLQGEEGTVGCSLLSWWPPASQGSSAFPPWPLWAASCKQMASALLVAS